MFHLLLNRLLCYVISCFSGSSSILSPADNDLVLFDIMLIWFIWCNIACWSRSSVIKHHADPVRLLLHLLLIRIQCYIRSCWSDFRCIKSSVIRLLCYMTSYRSGSYGLKSPADRDIISCWSGFFWYKISCWSGFSVIYNHADPVLLVKYLKPIKNSIIYHHAEPVFHV